MNMIYQYNQFYMRRQVFALTGKMRIYGPQGELLLYSQQKMFKLREDIRAYSDESRSQEMLYIQARNIIDFSAAYDVMDSQTGEHVGVLRRRGWRSLARDEWEVLNANEQPLGILIEDNLTQALLRRFILGSWLPQNYDILIGEQRVADIRQRFNPFRYELDIDFSMDTSHKLDHRLGIAAAILLGTIEGRQHKE